MPISESQAKALKEYRMKRDAFLKANPTCAIPGCALPSTLHHARGRTGKNLTDESAFRALCSIHHQWVENHPTEAKEMDYSEDRLAKKVAHA